MFLGRPSLVRLAAAAAAGASCLAVGACGPGGGSSASTASTASAAASASAAADPLAGLAAGKVATEALANLKAAPNVTMSGTLTDSGTKYTLNLGLQPGKGCTGTIGTSQGTIKLIVIGKTVYLNPDDKFWRANSGASADSVIALVGGKYIETSTSNKSMGSLSDLCNLSKSIGATTSSDHLVKGALTTFHGIRVLPLKDSSDGSAADVTDTSKPEIVAVNDPGSGVLTLSTDTPVKLTVPPASQVIDGSKVGL